MAPPAPPTRPRPSTARSGTVALSAVRPRAQPIEEGQAHAPPRASGQRRRRRRIVTPGRLLALGCVIGLLAAFWLATRQVYFVGVDESRGNVVTLYHGLPYDLPLGIRLYSPVRHSGVTFEQVPANRRGTFTDHKLRSKDDAESLVLAARAGQDSVSARNRELLALIPASLLLTAGFAAIFIQRSEILSDVSLTYGGIFLGLCFAGHLVIRFTLPHADPYLFPLVAVLACFGLVVVYRIDEDLARDQAQWFVIGLIFFVATIFLLRDFRVLERYRYTIALAGLALLLLPRVPGIGQQVNGAYLGVKLGPVSFQPAELGKIAIVIFLAAYLRDNRQVLVQGGRRFLGVTIPPLKHLGPLLVVWGAAMLMLVFIRDLGSSLMYFGAFLALLYVATNRLSFVVVGMVMFAAGAWFFASTVGHVQDRIDIWLDPFPRYDDAGYQIANGLFAQADGGLFGRGLGAAILNVPGGGPLIPAPETDMIYAVIVNDLGLVGGCRAARDLPADRRARLQDRDAGHRLVLEAARHGPDGGDGAAGVRDRRRRHARDPADRRDAAVRVLRRLLDRGQLHPARAAAGDLQPGARNRHERADLPPLRAVRRAVRASWSRSARAGPCSAPPACARTRRTAAW